MHGFVHLSRTNFLVFNLMKLKHNNLPFIILILVSLVLSACSSNTSTTTRTPSDKTIVNEIKASETAEEKLALAQAWHSKSTPNTGSLINNQAIVNNLLIESSELFIIQQDYLKALWLANEISKLQLSNLEGSYRLLLVKASALNALDKAQEAFKQLELAKQLVILNNSNITQTASVQLTYKYYLELSKVQEKQGKYVLALAAALESSALNPSVTNEDINTIWHKLSVLPQWQITQLIAQNPPFISGWINLLEKSAKYGDKPLKFSNSLKTWQQQHSEHPANFIADSILLEIENNSLPEVKIENIAVFLPLSGGQKQAGLAAQQGVLAAYENIKEGNIHFFDTNELEWENIQQHFVELNIDHVIGPLLKSNVDTFLEKSVQHIELQIPALLLNLPSVQQLSTGQFALSMRPEDEAIQAATTLSQRNYQNPLILSHNDRVSKRIAIAFREQWKLANDSNVDIVYFNEGKAMQDSLKSSLDVTASEIRIKQLSSKLPNNLKTETRSRRDIDMIYIVGTAAQTRLAKPYIDVSISPFADAIPIFASSRSHSHFNDKFNASSTSDLQGLTFTQIPWLLNSKQQDKALNKLSEELWPKRYDSLSRIFAMGFDSFNVLNKLTAMEQSPFIHHFGQTGVLQLNTNNILTRSLIWGQYKNDKVTQIVLD